MCFIVHVRYTKAHLAHFHSYFPFREEMHTLTFAKKTRKLRVKLRKRFALFRVTFTPCMYIRYWLQRAHLYAIC